MEGELATDRLLTELGCPFISVGVRTCTSVEFWYCCWEAVFDSDPQAEGQEPAGNGREDLSWMTYSERRNIVYVAKSQKLERDEYIYFVAVVSGHYCLVIKGFDVVPDTHTHTHTHTTAYQTISEKVCASRRFDRLWLRQHPNHLEFSAEFEIAPRVLALTITPSL